jgi:hypothetical protein
MNWRFIIVAAMLAAFAAGMVLRSVPNADAMSNDKWSEYAVYAIAAQRMAVGDPIHVRETDRDVRRGAEAYGGMLGIEASRQLAARIDSHTYSYPPLAAFIAIPFAAAHSWWWGAVAWYLLMFAATCLAVWAAWRLVFAKPDPGLAATRIAPAVAYCVVVAVCFGLLDGPLKNMQTDALVMLGMFGGGLLLARGKGLAAGLAFGFAAAFKGPMLVALPWLLWRRRWGTAAAMVAAAVGLNLLPDLWFHSPTGELWAVDWWQRVVVPSLHGGDPTGSGAGIWIEYNFQNQSLAATLLRILTGGRGPELDATGLGWVSVNAAHTVAYCAMTLTTLASLCAVGWTRAIAGSTKPWDAVQPPIWCRRPDEPAGIGIARELSLVLMLSLLLSPMTSPAHLCVLLLPVAVLMREAIVRRDRASAIAFILVAAILVVLNKGIVGKNPVDLARFWGSGTLTVLVLFAAIARICIASRRAASPPAPNQPA